mgnify:CR=1 FL=1
MTTGQRIAEKRKGQGLSQEALGTALGVSRQSVYKWESDSALPEIDKLIAISRMFGVTVGWLLGTEDGGAAPAAAESGALTGQQLRMVEEIADRYLAAQPPVKKRRWPWLLGLAAAIAALVFLGGLQRQLSTLQANYRSIQQSVAGIAASVDSQIASITGRVEEALKQGSSLTASYQVEIAGADLVENTLTLSACAVPKTYTQGLEAVFLVDSGEGGAEFPAILGEDGAFRGELRCTLTDSLSVSVAFIQGDVRETQLLETYYGWYSDSRPQVYLRSSPAYGWSATAPDMVRLSGTASVQLTEGLLGISDGSLPVQVAEVRVGFFLNRTLASWMDPGENSAGTATEQALPVHTSVYSLPEMELALTEEDLLSFAALVTDEYGRQFVFAEDYRYIPDSAGGRLEALSQDGEISSPDQWRYE